MSEKKLSTLIFYFDHDLKLFMLITHNALVNILLFIYPTKWGKYDKCKRKFLASLCINIYTSLNSLVICIFTIIEVGYFFLHPYVFLPAPLRFSSCTSTILKMSKLALTFYLKKGTVVECVTNSSIQKWIMLFSGWGGVPKENFNKLLIFGYWIWKPN